MKHPRLMDPNEALYDVTCFDCDDEDGIAGLSLSHGGNNLSRRAALAAIKRHRTKHPQHGMSWTAVAPVGGI